MEIVPVILSGGAGTRLWPLSTSQTPKQFLPLLGSHSLLQQTIIRMRRADIVNDPILVTNVIHGDQLDDQLKEVGCAPFRLIREPAGRNTAPAIALAALEAPTSETLLLVLPSDHVIKDATAFGEAIRQAVPHAEKGWLVTFGVRPEYPETGYGYIRAGADISAGVQEVEAFVEKPDAVDAAIMIAEGGHFWNAGIFLFRADALLGAMRTHASDILEATVKARALGHRHGFIVEPEPIAFSDVPAKSIDYAVMEKAAKVAVVPVSMGWSDLGSWDMVHAVGERDAAENVVDGDVTAIDSRNCLLRTTGTRIATIGVSDLIVIVTADAVLIAPRGQSQDVRRLAEQAGTTPKAVENDR
ncbi:MAG: mannose-1-phosphate guanylyltransferase/mannose-6-phosphate isomerase [Sphingomonadales bacterium]|jgi:mannose-1-phosphate guanylyltransferase|nr:MAG: mannose-1-phosphate guanylyltransferase/mannose-6-phosphate isomerase [Alphaproteobacteria bacterium]TNF05235.1 MAG: mannose-1-phosphate guanylyltransferase/mannose-6-phosphate isomerase [Sphingomonadales bacterium]